MGDQSAIEWTEATWNPIVGCSRVSEGCRHCYAERQAYRAEAMGIPQYAGMTRKVGREIRWTGKVALVETALHLPLTWKKPRRIFVNSMSDLFHEQVPDEWIDGIFARMVLTNGRHTFQVLTKRPERMLAYMTAPGVAARVSILALLCSQGQPRESFSWPLPNVWLGVSVEDQATADARIPLLLQTPAAVRWVSYEPALGPVDFRQAHAFACHEHHYQCSPSCDGKPGIRWLVVGGESGPGARPFDLAWARQTIAQGRAAGVPVFVKQVGRWVLGDDTGFRVNHWLMKDGRGYVPPIIGRFAHVRPHWAVGFSTWNLKGGDPADWPEDLRVREYPRA